jgi:hypothetical protein
MPITLVPKQERAVHSPAFLASLPHPGPPLPVSVPKAAKPARGRGRPRKDANQDPAAPSTSKSKSKGKGKGKAQEEDATVLLAAETEEFDFGEALDPALVGAGTASRALEENEDARVELDVDSPDVDEDARVRLPGDDDMDII